MNATAIVGSDDTCGASLRPFTDCEHNHQHAFADPEREGGLLAGWATLQPKPDHEAIPYTDPLPSPHPEPEPDLPPAARIS